MAQSDAEKLVNLGVPTQQAKILADMTSGQTYTDADAEAAIAAKTDVAALDSDSTAADIVAALQA